MRSFDKAFADRRTGGALVEAGQCCAGVREWPQQVRGAEWVAAPKLWLMMLWVADDPRCIGRISE